MSEPFYLGTADLARRWNYSVRGIRNLIVNEPDFPAPAFAVNAGHIRVWTLPEIEAWEARHPETQDATAKKYKTRYAPSFRRAHNLPWSKSTKPPGGDAAE